MPITIEGEVSTETEVDPIAAQIAREQREAPLDAGPTPPAALERLPANATPIDQTQVDPIAAQIAAEQKQEATLQTNLLKYRAINDTTDAGRRADVLRYTAAAPQAGLGNLTPEFVEANLDEVKAKVDAERVNWNAVAHRQPSLVKFLLERPSATPLVKDDSANLGGIEWALTAPFHAFLDASMEQTVVARQFAEAQGFGSDENRKEIAELEEKYSNKDYGADGFFSQGLIGGVKMAPYLIGNIAAMAAGGAIGAKVGGTGGAAAGAAAGAPAGPAAAPGAVAGGVAGGVGGAGVGAYVASGLFNYYEAVGPLYARLSHLKDANGNPMDPDVARAFAQGAAVVQGGMMAGFMGKFAAKLPGVGKLLARFSANTLEKALVQQTTGEAIKQGITSYGKHWGTGVMMMGAQGALNGAAAEAAKAYSGPDFNAQWENVATEGAASMKAAIVDMSLISALGPGREMIVGVGRARASAESAAKLEAMTSSAAASKLLERSPKAFRDFVEKIKGEKGAVENVRIPVEEWTRYWQTEKLDPGEVAADVVGDGGKAFADAQATKGDVVIPVERYLEKLSKTDHAAGLSMDAKLYADELTPRQHVAEQERIKERMAEELKVRGEELNAGKKEVFDFINDQARASGTDKAQAADVAKQVSEYAGTLALRLGIGVREAAALGSLGQLRILGPKGYRIAEAARAKFQEFLRPEASKLLEQRFATLNRESKATEYYIDDISGLRNRRLFDELPRTPGTKTVAITLLDSKPINDHETAGGHEVTNEVLRAAGLGVHEALPEGNGARGGTTFFAEVPEGEAQAKLEAAIAKIKENTGDPSLTVVGAIGEHSKGASDALDKLIDAGRLPRLREASNPPEMLPPELPARGVLTPGVDVEGLPAKLKQGKAAGVVPENKKDELHGLTPREYAEQVYLDTVEINGQRVKTGVLTAEGWRAIGRKAHAAAIDGRGLKKINDTYGKAVGNEMLRTIGEAFRMFGGTGFDVAHLSGDEYVAQHNDPLVLENFVQRVNKYLQARPIRLIDSATGKEVPVPVDFRYGTGRDYATADRDLNARKRAAEGGDDAGRSVRPGEGAPGPVQDRTAGVVEVKQSVEGRYRAVEAREPGRGVGGQEFSGLEGPDLAESDGRGVGGAPGDGGGDGHGGLDASFDPSRFAAVEHPPAVLAAVREKISRFRAPGKKERALAWFDFVTGKTTERPTGDLAVTDKLEREFAEQGLIDPEGFGYGENSRSLEYAKSHGHTTGASQPEQLKAHREGAGGNTQLEPTRGPRKPTYKQEELVTYVEGQPVTYSQEGKAPALDAGFHSPNAFGKVGTPEHQVANDMLEELGALPVKELTSEAIKTAWERRFPIEDELARYRRTQDVADENLATHIDRVDVAAANEAGSPDYTAAIDVPVGDSLAPDAAAKREASYWKNIEKAVRLAVEKGDRTLLYSLGKGDGKPRGTIEMQLDPTGRPRAFDINVLNGDKSTLVHETAHFLSWSLHDIATSTLATPDVVKDYGELIKWAGYESPEQRLAETKERAALMNKEEPTRQDKARLRALDAKEERISHGWEQYLLEGKSPSEALGGVFRRFRGWLTDIYKGLPGIQKQYRDNYGQELAFSPQVRAIFDRLLAQNEALETARVEAGMPTTPPPLPTAAMSPAEREEYRKAITGARIASEGDLARATAELENGKIADARERISSEVTQELDRQPVHRAERYLQEGEMVDSEGNLLDAVPEVLLDEEGRPFKVNRKAFVERFGPDVARLMPAGIFARTKKGGVDIDQLGPVLGFESGEDLVNAFRQNEPRGKAIARETQNRIDTEFGPALQRMADAAMSAVHNDDAARATLLELRALAKEVDPAVRARTQSISLKTLKDSAERLVGGTSITALDPANFARIERQTALRAAELWGRGQKEASLEQSEARLFNQVLYRAARDAQAQVDKIQNKLEKTNQETRAKLGKADPSYRDVHDTILAAVGIGEKPVDGRTLEQMIEKATNDAQTVDFDVEAIRKLLAAPREWESLTVDEARNIGDAVTNIRHIASNTNEVNFAGKKQSKDAWFKEFGEGLRQLTPVPPKNFDRAADTTFDKFKHLGRGADALLTDVPETYAHILDNGNRDGPMHRLLVDGRLEARDKASKLQQEILKPIMEAWEKVPKGIKKLRDQKVDVANLLPVPVGTEGLVKPVYTRSTLWSLFLNWGNEGNRQRIRDGNGWSDSNVEKALSMLTKPEVDFLKSITERIESLYPELASVYEKRTGLALGKVEATPITINGEVYPGHYFPLKYRADLSRAGELQEGDLVKALFAPNYQRPAVARGHTKDRLDKVAAPVDLNWGVVPAHFSQVIHDISYGEWVREAGSILLDPKFKALTQQYLGLERSSEFVPWIRDVANARADSASGAQSTLLDTLSGFARNRAAVVALGFNLPSIAQQVLDPWNALQENVGAHHIAAAYVKVNTWLSGAIQMPEFALSKELAYRSANVKANMRTELARMGPTGEGLGRKVSETAFALYELSDHYTTRVSWKAAFDHAQSEGMPREEAAARADDVVRRIFASHELAEKPPIMRSKKGIAGLVMFYGFANRLYNSQRRGVADLWRTFGDNEATGADKTRAVARFAANLIQLGATGAACAYLAGRGPKKEEDAKKWLSWRVALEPFNLLPFVGGAVEGLIKGDKISLRTSPELALMQDVMNRLGDTAKKVIEGGPGANEEQVLTAIEALTGVGLVAAGLPATQALRSSAYARKLKSGEARPRNALQTAGGLIYGEQKEPRRNPLTDLGDALAK